MVSLTIQVSTSDGAAGGVCSPAFIENQGLYINIMYGHNKNATNLTSNETLPSLSVSKVLNMNCAYWLESER